MKNLKIHYGFRENAQGASLVEFVLILPLLILFSLGMFEATNYIMLSAKLNEIASGMQTGLALKPVRQQLLIVWWELT